MNSGLRIRTALVCVFALLSHQASTQQPATQQPPERPVFRTGTNLAIIDAVVVDRAGRHVRDLTADDFEIVQEGRTHQVRQALFVTAGPVPAAPASAAPTGEKSPVPPAAPPPPSRG